MLISFWFNVTKGLGFGVTACTQAEAEQLLHQFLAIRQRKFDSLMWCSTSLLRSSTKSMSFQILGLWLSGVFGILGTMCSVWPNHSFKADGRLPTL